MRHLRLAIAAAAIASMPRAVAFAPRAAANRGGSTATTTGGAAGADPASTEADNLTAASSDDLEASGAMMEPEIRDRIDVNHPAVDNNPREGQPAVANQIDFNDPTKTDAEAVAENLKAQGGTKTAKSGTRRR